jgi:hypothetical protein
LKHIFMSHSRKDATIIEVFNEVFAKTGVKPIWMEYEKWSQRVDEPNWSWISRHIRMPDTVGVFVLLTRNVTDTNNPKRTLATQNWVAYEVGVASTSKPAKPVYVFKEEDVDFPVPYLTNFMPYSVTKVLTSDEKEWLSPEYAEIVKDGYMRATRFMIEDLKTGRKSPAPEYRCDSCLLSFHYHGTSSSFKCPCCSAEIRAC